MIYTNFYDSEVMDRNYSMVSKDEAEKFLGIEIPNVKEGFHYWKYYNSISYVSDDSIYGGATLNPMEYWFMKKNGKVFFRYRGTISANCCWTDWEEW